jgi:hemoglobin
MKAFTQAGGLAALIAGAALLIATPALADGDAAGPMGSANPAGADPIPGDGVYKAFHEEAGIDRIIDDFVGRITTDPRIAERFQNANLARLRLELKQQVCYLTGGPCAYSGKDMKTAHQSMGLQNLDFNALAEDLQLAMDKEQVSFAAQNRLLAKLAPMQRVIVTK